MSKILFTYFFIFLSFTCWPGKAKGQGNPSSRNPHNSEIVVVKLKENISISKLQNRLNSGKRVSSTGLRKALPHLNSASYGKSMKLLSGKLSFGLDRIYKIEVPEGKTSEQLIEELQEYSFIEYVEPYYQRELLHIPDDPEADPVSGRQDHLELIKAYEAWEVEKGDSTIVIGILDTGVNLNHVDLKDNIYRNEADPINGIDDDGDGYIDNYYGYDFANEDNDPTDFNGHGTVVTGVGAARTDNGTGIAGLGFNSKFMPIKVFTDNPAIFYNGYEAILYAAQKGCKVINLSWGSNGTYGKYEEDIINTVVLDMDVVVVAAAGNSNANEDYYPASYEYVMSVANTQKTDEKAPGSTFSPYIDITAPGFGIYTTNNNGYAYSSGSSLSSPNVAGAAALVRARFPELSALQVMERLRVTADDIYDVGNNSDYLEHLGKGRLNMYQALIDTTSPAVRFREMDYANKIGKYAFRDDTVTITGKLVNYLREVTNLNASLSISSPHVEVISADFQTPSLPTMGSATATFKVYISSELPPGEKLRFRLGLEGDDYKDYQYFDIPTVPDYITVNTGSLAMTIGSNGNLGYNSDIFREGTGITLNDDYLLDFASLIVGESTEIVSDNMYNSYYSLKRAKDFEIIESIKINEENPDVIEVASHFSDMLKENTAGVSITQTLTGFKSEQLRNFLLLQYNVKNISGHTKDTLKVGLFTDWDIVDSMMNQADYDPIHRLGYTFYPEEGIYAGVALLSDQEIAYQALELYDEDWNFVLGSEISEEEKFKLLENDESKHQTQLGNPASTLSAIAYDIDPEEITTVKFAIVAGYSLEELQKNTVLAHLNSSKFTEVTYGTFCNADSLIIRPGLGEEVYYYSDSLLTNLIGQGAEITLKNPEDGTALYWTKKEHTYYQKYKAALHISEDFHANFSMANDFVLLNEENPIATVQMTDESYCASRWEWIVNSTVVSNQASPLLTFDKPGVHSIKLKVWNNKNEVDSVIQILKTDFVTAVGTDENKDYAVYPNPVSETLNLNLPLSQHVKITITDQVGRSSILKEERIIATPHQVDVSHLVPGLYIIRIEAENTHLTSKLVVE